MLTIINGKIHNDESKRPAIGTNCRIITIKSNCVHESKALYTIENILVNGGRYDTYVLKNTITGKVKNASIIGINEYVSISDFSQNIQACITGNNAMLDFQALESELRTCKYETVRHAIELFDMVRKGYIAAAFELWSYMICDNFTGKMKGNHGISTSVKLNLHCQLAQKDNSCICHDCYAEKIRESQAYKLALNTLVLCTYRFQDCELPYLNCHMFRLESFGDLLNTTQAYNYIALSRKNFMVTFAQWTKRPAIMHNAFTEYFQGIKPENMIVVYSSKRVNHCEDISGKFILANGQDMINHVFTVYTASYAIEHNIVIHCLKSVCVNCQLCYRKDSPYFINEIIKKEQNTYIKMKGNLLS